MPLELIKDHISRDTVSALAELHEAAKAGHITGIAFAATIRRNKYITNVAGDCHKNPTMARGMICALDDELAAIVHHREQDETR